MSGIAVGRKTAIIETIALIMIWVMFSVLIIQAVISPSDNVFKNKDRRIKLIGEYTFDNETWYPLVDESDYDNLDGKRYVKVRGYFKQTVEEKDTLCLNVDNIQVKFSVNDEVLANFGEPGTYPKYSVGPGQCYIEVERDGIITPEDVIEVELTNPYKRHGVTKIHMHLHDMFIAGPTNALYFLHSEADWPFCILGIIFIVVGLMVNGAMGLYMKDGIRVRIHQIVVMSTFATFSIVSGYFLITNSLKPVLPILVHNPTLCNVIDELSDYLLCLGVLVNYMAVVTKPKLMHALWHTSLWGFVLFIVIAVMQLLGISDLYEFEEFPLALGSFVTLFAVPIMIYEWQIMGKQIARIQLIIMTPFILCCTTEVLNRYVFHMFIDACPENCLVKYGIALTGSFQFYRMVKLARSSSRKQIEYEKTKAELSEARISMTISQIQPHFLYNALNTIQYLCATDPQKAGETVEKFAKYLRGNMDSLTNKEPIPFEKELEHLENYLAIERLRFPDINFVYKLEATNFNIPALSIQPLVENSIKHGVRSLGEGAVISVSTWNDEKSYYIRVEDNGIGFDPKAKKKPDGRSHVGMENIVSRVENMVGGKVTIESEIGKGTRTTIEIPRGE